MLGKNMKNKEFLSIGRIAKEAGVLSSTIRYYTNMGLLKVACRTKGNYRVYNEVETIKKLKQIIQLKKEGYSLDEIEQKVVKEPDPINIFKQYPVKFAYLFGSQAKGNVTALSDVDIAVFLNESLTDKQQFKLRLELIEKLSREYKVDNIDIVALNKSSLFLSFNIVITGKLLYCNDETRRIQFESKIMSLYFDQDYYYKRHSKLAIERIAAEGIL